jgi:hypothetical protein
LLSTLCQPKIVPQSTTEIDTRGNGTEFLIDVTIRERYVLLIAFNGK